MKPSVAFVANEPLEPTVHGGRVRMAGLVNGLRQLGIEVTVIELNAPADAHRADGTVAMRPRKKGRLAAFASPRPRLGAIATAGLANRLADVVSGSTVTMVSQSYLAPFVTTSRPLVVDFQNVESLRFRSFAAERAGIHKWSARLEGAKADRWEPAVARTAALVLACNPDELDLLRSWGATGLYVPHGSDASPVPPSPDDGYVLFVGSGGYGPNHEAATWLMTEVWPGVLARRPQARLRIVGRDTTTALGHLAGPGIDVVGEVPSLEPEYAGAVCALGPVRSGGGAQLKVVNALANGRVVVATAYSAQSAPEAPRGAVVVAPGGTEGYADTIVAVIDDPARRHEAEAALNAAPPVPPWAEVVAPLAEWLRQAASERR